MDKVEIIKVERFECDKKREAALANIEELEGKKLTAFGQYYYNADKMLAEKMERYIAAMNEANKDYVYLKKGVIFPYKLGDAIFSV